MTSLQKCRIAFLLPHLSTGGAERVIVNLLRHLDRERFEPILILRDRRGDLLADVPDDVTIDDLCGARAVSAIPQLRRRFETRAVSVVYAGTNVANLVALAAAATMRRPPAVIVSEHTPLSHYWASAKWRHIRRSAMRLLYRRAWAIVVPIAEIADECRELLGPRGGQVHVITNPVLEDIRCHNEGGVPEVAGEGQLTLVAAGRLEYVKGFDLLIEAADRLARANSNFRLTILGEGPERGRLEARIDELGLRACVELPGRVPNPEDYYRKAFAVIVSSRFESGPNVLVEAMAVGTPVISADCPFGPRRILRDGEFGLLVPPESPDAIVAAVQRLVGDRKLYGQLQEKGLRRARDFTVEVTLPAYEQLFAAAAASRRAS